MAAVRSVMGGSDAPAQQAAPPMQAPQQQYSQAPVQQQNVCQFELQQFLDCTSRYSSDLTLCSQFNDALKQCRLTNNSKKGYCASDINPTYHCSQRSENVRCKVQ